MSAYYNEFDKNAAQWLRELIKLGLIADGEVDDRSILEVTPNDLKDFTQCHFFAGIGVWSHALRQAGISDDTPVWTGSCPCQPFSSAGKGAGVDDERHLWPAFHWLIKQCRPDLVFGEQVAHKAGAAWFDIVSTDLEGEDYTCGKIVLPACGLGAPHLRVRQYWVGALADAKGRKRRVLRDQMRSEGSHSGDQLSGGLCGDGQLGIPESEGLEGQHRDEDGIEEPGRIEESKTGPGGDSSDPPTPAGEPRATNGFWGDADWLGCIDGRFRSVERGTFPLADGSPSELVCSGDLGTQDVEATKEGRTMRLKGYGNAIVAQQAQAFIEAAFESISD